MTLRIDLATALPDDLDAVGVFVFENLVAAEPGRVIERESLERLGFSGKAGEVSLVRSDHGALVAYVGLGSTDDPHEHRLRQAAADFARAVASCNRVALDLRPLSVPAVRVAQVAAEGVTGATYSFSSYKSDAKGDLLQHVSLVVNEADAAQAGPGLDAGVVVGEAVALARDLGNTPAGDMTPTKLAETALAVAAREGLEAQVLDEDGIVAERLGGLLAVARGSVEPPRLIRLEYKPEGAGPDVPTVVLVGKGITFDSGGLSLKPAEGMMAMKTDMSGAAAVIAALGACRRLGVSVRVIGITPTTENMPGGRATKPGDVFRARNGKTVEVLNTDAEGRLVLADGLSLAAEEAPDAIIDLATLTGACVVALGRKMAGLMGNDSRLVAAVERAGDEAGEPFWHLPLPRMYRKDIDSEVADMKNIGKPGSAGSLVAGLLLEEFVGDTPWAHLDIAGPSRAEEESHELRKGSTGFGVRTMLELLRSYEAVGAPADGRASRMFA